jgi:hypothetical protein
MRKGGKEWGAGEKNTTNKLGLNTGEQHGFKKV